jgi:hypothetical protein
MCARMYAHSRVIRHQASHHSVEEKILDRALKANAHSPQNDLYQARIRPLPGLPLRTKPESHE